MRAIANRCISLILCINLVFSLIRTPFIVQAMNEQTTLIEGSIPFGISSLYYRVDQHGDKQEVYVQNSDNEYKTYYLDGKYTDDVNTMNFISMVNDVSKSMSRAITGSVVSILIAIVLVLSFMGFVLTSPVAIFLYILQIVLVGSIVYKVTDTVGDYESYVRYTKYANDIFGELG